MASQCSICSFRFMQIAMFLICLLLIYYGNQRWYEPKEPCFISSLGPFIVLPNRNPANISNLPKLAELQWPKPYVASYPAGSKGPNGALRPLPSPLEPVMSMGQLRLTRRLLRVFSELMFSNGFGDRFFLAGGTLVGTFLFHDLVPWDDDTDVFVDYKLRGKIQNLLSKLPEPYKWHAQTQRDKLYTSVLPDDQNFLDLEMSRRPFKYPWAWPFLDICYFKSNGTHFSEFNPNGKKTVSIPLSIIFPTYFRPLGEDWFPAPRDTELFLNLWYGRKVGCLNGGYSHALEGVYKGQEVPCQMLLHRYAQVERSHLRTDRQVWNNTMNSIRFHVMEERLIMYSDFGLVLFHRICLPLIGDRHRAQ